MLRIRRSEAIGKAPVTQTRSLGRAKPHSDRLGGPDQVGEDEADPRVQLPLVPFDVSHHPAGSGPALRLVAEAVKGHHRLPGGRLPTASADGRSAAATPGWPASGSRSGYRTTLLLPLATVNRTARWSRPGPFSGRQPGAEAERVEDAGARPFARFLSAPLQWAGPLCSWGWSFRWPSHPETVAGSSHCVKLRQRRRTLPHQAGHHAGVGRGRRGG
jgi:hypothetical protein